MAGSVSHSVKLRDVAEAAGVSIATASRALAGKDRVSERAREDVRQAARRLGYHVDPLGRALREGLTRTVGMVAPSINDPFIAELVAACAAELRKSGQDLVLADSADDWQEESRLISNLLSQKVNGIILVPHDCVSDHPKSTMAGMALVQVGRKLGLVETDFVGPDDEIGVRLILEHLKEQGVQSVALISSDERHSSDIGRKGLVAAMGGRLELEIRSAFYGRQDASTGRHGARAIIESGSLPDAILAGSAVAAFGAIRELRDADIEVPRDVLVASLDGTALGETYTPSLTSIVQPLSSIASEGIALLARRIENPDQPIRAQRIAPTLSVRESTMKHGVP